MHLGWHEALLCVQQVPMCALTDAFILLETLRPRLVDKGCVPLPSCVLAIHNNPTTAWTDVEKQRPRQSVVCTETATRQGGQSGSGGALSVCS